MRIVTVCHKLALINKKVNIVYYKHIVIKIFDILLKIKKKTKSTHCKLVAIQQKECV